MRKFLKENSILITILLIGAFFRLYKIGEYMTFLGDEGRDAIIVRRFLVDFDLMLIGPGTSIGNMYLGPLYYYLISPFLWLFNFSPVGPSVLIALIGVATIFMVYYVGLKWFSKRAGLIAATLYAISPTVIIFSKSSWNPNIMPFFSLLAIYSIWMVWKRENFKWLLTCAISYAFVLQSHYFGLLLAPVLGFYWILIFLKTSFESQEINEKAKVVRFIKLSAISLVIFLGLMSPLLFFDIRHDWINYKAASSLFVTGEDAFSKNIWASVIKLPEVLNLISTRLLAGRMETLGKIIVAVISIPSVLFLLGRKRLHTNEASGFSTLTIWMIAGLFGLGLFKFEIHDHYFGLLFTAPFLFLAGFIDGVFDGLSKIGKTMLIFLFLFVVYINIINSPLKYSPNKQLQRAQNVSSKIIEESKETSFNLAVLAERNYEDGYAYFLEKEGYTPLHADIWDSKSISNQLFVVCEMEEVKCDPTHSPKAEVANFGWSKIEEKWEVDGVIIYKLIHSR
ncbi:MAG TPA: glycosyltransferase family 39 protein [Patescibacteria group bacterium]|nr:glycosyltransferase family 39 protein [Patescibacteria group bacterium]